jgi:hypothetical protein
MSVSWRCSACWSSGSRGPVVVVLLLGLLDEDEELTSIASIAAILTFVGLMVAGVVRQRRDPLLLVGRVTEGLIGIKVEAGKVPGLKDLAWNYAFHGSWREVTVYVVAACRITADGSLVAEPRWRGERDVGAKRRVERAGIQGEKAVFVAAGNGPLIGLLGDLVEVDRR